MKSTLNNESPGNGGLTKEFYETFGSKLLIYFMKDAITKNEKWEFHKKQTVIKLIEKQDKD